MMNPLPVVLADLRAMRKVGLAVVALVAIAVAVGVALAAQERSFRKSSARAADDFDLIVAAPGSQTQLVLTTVYLQPEALPLMDGQVINRLASDPRVKAVAPIAFGDFFHGYPIVGTTQPFVTRWGRVAPAEGRAFTAEGEAVVGADVRVGLGDTVLPSHGAGPHPLLGAESEEEASHRHAGAGYRVVGRLPRFGSPWDRAILVPVESVWEVHGLGDGHVDPAPAHGQSGEAAGHTLNPGGEAAGHNQNQSGEAAGHGRAAAASPHGDGPLGPPFLAAKVPGVPALVVKPKAVADAYALRAQYRQGGTMALFPAEVLVTLYRTMGDVRDVLVVASALDNVLVFAAVLLVIAALSGLRRQRYAVLRALGAPRIYVLLVVWLGAASLIAAGAVGGLALGWGGAVAVSALLETRTGLGLAFMPDWSDLGFVAMLVVAGATMALVPALVSYGRPIAEGLKES